MLIFDGFTDEDAARRFVATVQERFGRECFLFADVDSANESDPFPFALTSPIVHVERTEDYAAEDKILLTVREFDGRFAGT